MARSIRIQFAGARYHIINRGNYRLNLFSTHKTAEAFTKALFEACDRCEWWLHAYVIMSNHFHLCLETPQANLVDGMHWLQSSFANRFSKFIGERGHVFQGRYKSLILDGDFSLLKVVDYIHLNPVRANLISVDQLKNFKYSSFPKYFGKHRHPRLRCEDFLKEAGGLESGLAGMRRYHLRLKGIMEESPQKRKELFSGLSQGWYIGSKEGKRLLSEEVKQGEIQASKAAQEALANERGLELLKSGLKALKKSNLDVEKDRKSVQWKLALASWIKERSPVQNRDISEHLNMGHPATMSNNISAYRKARQKSCQHYRKLKKILKY